MDDATAVKEAIMVAPYRRRKAPAELRKGLGIILLYVISITVSAHAGEVDTGGEDKDLPYRVVEGRVDESTYTGWRVFHSACYLCHGVDAVGTDVAPSLVDTVSEMSASDFAVAVLNRYRIALSFGDAAKDGAASTDPLAEFDPDEVLSRKRGELMMPAWERSPAVKPHVLDIYAYVRARSDGVLGPGRPEKMQQ
jgi:hypothetical protein